MIIKLEDIQAKRSSILAEGANSILGTCSNYDWRECIKAGIMQVWGVYDVPDNIEEILELFCEKDMDQALSAAGIDECAVCGWWCDDLWYTSEDAAGDVCGGCSDDD